jgi:hypothetical protein
MAVSYIGQDNLVRGLRNDNPGNIKAGLIPWQGAIGSDGVFVIFENIDWGLRALATDLANKIKRGVNTIRGIINVYAPPSENNTAAYIQAVVDDSGFGADQVIPTTVPALAALMRAVVNHELGEGPSYDYITDQDILDGISMISPSLQQLFQAAGIALKAAVIAPDGSVKWQNVAVGAGLVGLLVYLYNSKK